VPGVAHGAATRQAKQPQHDRPEQFDQQYHGSNRQKARKYG
jgi:hypothetical protein